MMSHILMIYFVLLMRLNRSGRKPWTNFFYLSAIGQIDKNKSCGLDGVYAEHLMYCSRRVLPLLAMCMSVFFCPWFPI